MEKRFPSIVIGYQVVDPAANDKVIHKGKYNLDNDGERRAFAERAHQAMADGHEIRSKMVQDRRQFAALGQLKKSGTK